MPLRDHFRPPTSKRASWEALHATWPVIILMHFNRLLPPGFVAEPRVHLGSLAEIDIATFKTDESGLLDHTDDGGSLATLTWATPSLAVETEVPDFDVYEVQVYDVERERQLVAAIEIVSPRNKDRAEARNAFVGKCAALLQQGVAVSIVDVVTTRHANLYAELLEFIGQTDPLLGVEPAGLYAVSCRWLLGERRAKFESRAHLLTIGHPLPTLPIWLAPKLVVPLDLEQVYEQACAETHAT